MAAKFLGLIPAFALFAVQAGAASSLLRVPADWIEVSAGSTFSLMAPAGTKYRPAKGIDSMIGTFVTPGFEMSFDYGGYSDPLNAEAGDKGYTARDLPINGKVAKLVTAYSPQRSPDRPYFIGVHFSDLEKSAIGSIKLTISSNLKNKNDYATLETIFRTIRFKK